MKKKKISNDVKIHEKLIHRIVNNLLLMTNYIPKNKESVIRNCHIENKTTHLKLA